MDGGSTSAHSGTQVPQKRVLPARSRRGGPGVGSCDVDLMILDRQKRRLEHDPLIPAETRLLLTTNPNTLAKSSTLELGKGVLANDGYSDQAELAKPYRERQIIQTPESRSIVETPTAMGRLRPRSSEDQGTADTSDAAYEKRHRKYEAFEKRIRLREKEKLKHEQYKLKERIDQLRAMDGGAFLFLPASSFSPIPGQRDDNLQDSRSAVPGARINGAAAHNEGERRRKEMLDVASSLEERYRILLPPDRFRKAPVPSTPNMSTAPEGAPDVGKDGGRYDAELNEELVVEAVQKESEKPKQSERLKLRIKVSRKDSGTGKTWKKQKKSLSSALEPINNERPQSLEPGSLDAIDHEPTPEPTPDLSTLPPRSRSSTPVSTPDIAALAPNSWDVMEEENQEHPYEASYASQRSTPSSTASSPPGPSPAAPPSESPEPSPVLRSRKRVKLSTPLPSSSSRNATRVTSVPPIESLPASVPRRPGRTHKQGLEHVSYAGVAGQPERTRSRLVVTAIRRSVNTLRQVPRHVNAFGIKLDPAVFVEEEYVLPTWVLAPDEREEIEKKN